ncbi:MAG: hypothetical protein ACRCUT_03000, partial [Spirochaetota bacterium]
YDIAQKKTVFTASFDLPFAGISGDGQYLYGASLDQSKSRISVIRVSVKTGKKESLSCACSGFRIDGVQISPDGRYGVFITTNSNAYVFDFQRGVWTGLIAGVSGIRIGAGDKDLYSDRTFAAAVPRAFYNSWDSTACTFDFAAGKTKPTDVNGAECSYYSPDWSKILIGFNDGSLQLYDAASMTMLGTAAAGAGVFGAIHPDGRYFGSSPAFLSLFHWVTGNEAVAITDFGSQFFAPGILYEILSGKPAGAKRTTIPVSVKRQLIGKVFAIDGNSIIVASSQSGSFVRGAKLFVFPDGGGTIELSITMPMHTSTKCSLKDIGKKKSVRKGMPVFKE